MPEPVISRLHEPVISRLHIRLSSLMRRPGEKFDDSDIAFGSEIQMYSTASIQCTIHFFTILLFSSFRDFEHSSIVHKSIFSMVDWNYLNKMKLFRMFMDYPAMFSKEHHFEAICIVLFNQYMKAMQDQSFKQFLITAMVHVMIKKSQIFPPHERDAFVTFFPDPKMMTMIYDMLQIKEVFFSDTVFLKKHKESPKSLDNVFQSINSAPNKTHKDTIQKILHSDPTFFQEWQPSILEYLHSDNDVLISAKGEKKWIVSMQTGCPAFLAAMKSFCVEDDTIRWIFFYTIQWNRFGEFKFVESLGALMNHLVYECQIPFPFMSPPIIFTKDYKGKQSGDREVGADPTKWGRILVRDLKRIFFGIRGINGDDIFLHEHKGIIKPQIKHLSSLLYAFRMRQNAMSSYLFQLKYAKALPVIQEGMRKRFEYNSQRKSAAILILLAIKRKGAMENFRILKAKAIILLAIKRRNDMEKFQNFARKSRIFQRKLVNFMNDQSCYECPVCFQGFDSVEIDKIQPCGHIVCKVCFSAIKSKCPCCRATFAQINCKSVRALLSESNPKFFFTSVNFEKKDAISVIGWAMKRRLVAPI